MVLLLISLLQAVTLNVLIGNGDAHAKNFSLLHNGSGTLTLARWRPDVHAALR
jgi:serine/threonine protein kinase HipA of HipAB toxin-antitoxin module